MTKLYYDAKTGFLCDRYPKDIPHTESSPFVEVEDEEAEKTLSCQGGTFWGVRDGKLQLLDDKDDTEYVAMLKRNHLADLHAYLDGTDYVVVKMAEAKLTGTEDEYQALLSKYLDTLKKREECRKEIDSLEGLGN